MTHYPTFATPWSPAAPVRPFRREGRAWRFEFPYKPSSTVPDSEPRYAVLLPDIGIALDDHGWLLDEPYHA